MGNWDRYSGPAKLAVLHAQNHAEESGTHLVRPLHLALGTLLADGNVREYLSRLPRFSELETALKERSLRREHDEPEPTEMSLSGGSRKAIDFAHEYARSGSSNRLPWMLRNRTDAPIQTEHLFCGALYIAPEVEAFFLEFGIEPSRVAEASSMFPAEAKG